MKFWQLILSLHSRGKKVSQSLFLELTKLLYNFDSKTIHHLSDPKKERWLIFHIFVSGLAFGEGAPWFEIYTFYISAEKFISNEVKKNQSTTTQTLAVIS